MLFSFKIRTGLAFVVLATAALAVDADADAPQLLADKVKIQRFLHNIKSRYANSDKTVWPNKWNVSVPSAVRHAKEQGLDLTIAKSDNRVQEDVLQQIAQAVKDTIDDFLPSGEKRRSNVEEGMLNRGVSNGVVAVPLRDIYSTENIDAEYLAQVQVGTPPQPYWLQVDSGSSDTWIASVRCQTTACKGVNGGRRRYNTSTSSTYAPTPSNKTFELYYSIGGVRGRMIRDNILFQSGASSVGVCAQTLGLARELSSDFVNDATDGVMGLGFRALTAAGERPILQNLFAQNGSPSPLKEKLVAFYLGRKLSGTQAKSEMRIGDVNKALFKGSIKWVPLTRKAYWSFKFGKFDVTGAGAKKSVSGSSMEGIVDTGTSYIAMPFDQASAFWAAVPGSQAVAAYSYWVAPCKTLASLSVDFTLPDGTTFKLNPADLSAGVAYEGSKNCIGTVFAAETGGKVIFGASLLKSLYLVLHWGQGKIGFAQAV